MLYRFYSCDVNFSIPLLKNCLSLLCEDSLFYRTIKEGVRASFKQIDECFGFGTAQQVLDFRPGRDCCCDREVFLGACDCDQVFEESYSDSLLSIIFQIQDFFSTEGFFSTKESLPAAKALCLIRFAFALGLIHFGAFEEEIGLTEEGKEWVLSEDHSVFEQRIYQMPVTYRMLECCLRERKTQFELGQAFGFRGEYGFESTPYELVYAPFVKLNGSPKENQLLMEGTADSFCRVYGLVLVQLGLFKVRQQKNVYTFSICEKGINWIDSMLNERDDGNGVFFFSPGLLLGEEVGAPFHFLRRYTLLNILNKEYEIQLDEIKNKMNEENCPTTHTELCADIDGMIRLGFPFSFGGEGMILNHGWTELEEISFIQTLAPNEVAIKKELLEDLKILPRSYLLLFSLYELIDPTFSNSRTTKKIDFQVAKELFLLFTDWTEFSIHFPVDIQNRCFHLQNNEEQLLFFWLPYEGEKESFSRYEKAIFSGLQEVGIALRDKKHWNYILLVNHETTFMKEWLPTIFKTFHLNGSTMTIESFLRMIEALCTERISIKKVIKGIKNNEYHFPKMKNYYS